MKKSNLLLSFLMAVTVLAFTSCEEDEPVIGGGEGIPVADGFYFAKDGVDPESTAQLKSAMVDAPSFSAMTRENFVQGYAYLTAGQYHLVEVTEKEITASYGGVLATISGDDVHNKECDADNSSYSLVMAEADGAAFAILTEGLYTLAYDATLGEIVFDQIESVGIIGGATPGGWDTDTPLTGTVNADGGSWSVEGVVLDQNQLKFRYNCRWAIDRRIDTDVDFDNTNGYSFFTNYGNLIGDLLPGNEGPNIEVGERAEYTVNFSWDPASGVSAALTKTGTVEPLPEYPAEMYMIGSAIGGWDWVDDPDAGVEADGIKLVPVANEYKHLFWAIVWMEAFEADGTTATGFKFAEEQDWGTDFGKTGDAADGVFAKGNDNVPGPATSGYYMVVVNLEADGTVEMNVPKVYGIGDAFDIGDSKEWDTANPNNIFTVDNVNKLIKFDSFPADAAELRIHVSATTLAKLEGAGAVDWWTAELIVLDGKIEYRGDGGDQARVAVTTGGSVSLNFSDGTGTVQ